MKIFATGWSENKDGPGQRLIFYLKGCNLRCRWCASPESIKFDSQILFYPERMKSAVDQVCPHGAVKNKSLNRKKCAICESRDCVEVWKNPCFELVGRQIFPTEIVAQAWDSREFFGIDGGVTFGGGEPTCQAAELLTTLKSLGKWNIHRCIESNAATGDFQKILGEVDYLICDLKCVDPLRHREQTGTDNSLILENLRRAARHSDFLLRIPLVPGLNDDPHEISRIAAFVGELGEIRRGHPLKVEILRFHHLGEPKYAALGWEYPMKNQRTPSLATVVALSEALGAVGATVIQT